MYAAGMNLLYGTCVIVDLWSDFIAARTSDQFNVSLFNHSSNPVMDVTITLHHSNIPPRVICDITDTADWIVAKRT